jgi:hypothetical protein
MRHPRRLAGHQLGLVARDPEVAEVAGSAGVVRVVLALPSWDDYLQTALDELIESGIRWPL